MASSRRGRFIAVVLLFGVATLGTFLWVDEGPLWRVVNLKKHHYEFGKDGLEHPRRGWVTVIRGSTNKCGPGIVYFAENGLKALEVEFNMDGALVKQTSWNFDGTVQFQRSDDMNSKTEPPWW